MSHQGCCSSQPAGDLAQVLMLDGAFDRSNATEVESALGDAIDADKPQLVIDLRGVSFLDSTMIRVLIQGLGATTAHGAKLALIRPNATVWRVFVLTGLSHTFQSFGRLDEAFKLPACELEPAPNGLTARTGVRCPQRSRGVSSDVDLIELPRTRMRTERRQLSETSLGRVWRTVGHIVDLIATVATTALRGRLRRSQRARCTREDRRSGSEMMHACRPRTTRFRASTPRPPTVCVMMSVEHAVAEPVDGSAESPREPSVAHDLRLRQVPRALRPGRDRGRMASRTCQHSGERTGINRARAGGASRCALAVRAMYAEVEAGTSRGFRLPGVFEPPRTD